MTVFRLARKAVFAFFKIINAMRKMVIGLIAALCCAGCTYGHLFQHRSVRF